MPQLTEEQSTLEGTVSSIIFQNEENGYTILRLDAGEEEMTVVGSMPGVSLPGWAVALTPAEELEGFFRKWKTPVIGRIHKGRLLLDVRTLLPGDMDIIAAALARLKEERP